MQKSFICGNLRRKFYLIYLLNVVDWVCTVLLLSTGSFTEANPIARTFIYNLYLGFFVKCLLPLIFIIPVCKFLYILDPPYLKVADMVISFGFTVYLAIIIDHIINFILLLIN